MDNKFVMHEGVAIMDDSFFIRNQEKYLSSRDSFDQELKNFILGLPKNIPKFPIVIETPVLSKFPRHIFHTFERKNKISFESLGVANGREFKRMRITVEKEYVTDYINALMGSTNKTDKIIEHLTSIKDLIDKIITEIK
jgi:hypothetical protein